MSRAAQRVELAAAFVLHQRPWRDTSRILEVLSRDHGRLTLFARGVRSPGAKLTGVLQPFQPLLLSWQGRGENPWLSRAERGGEGGRLPPHTLLGAFYINELLLKLTIRHDPQPALFDQYAQALQLLRGGAPLAPALRLFEKRLLELLGYAVELTCEARTGAAVDPQGWYRFHGSEGLVRTQDADPDCLSGASLLALERESLTGPRELTDAQRLLRAALDACLEGRPLKSRSVARAMRAARSP
ncbi:MAG: DNA repair protein RecO [Proteobacteria bacterium]|nr:DNA repair protein RecO [Pseudomonadota bacterium]